MTRPEFAHLELLAELDSLSNRLRQWAENTPEWQTAEKCRDLIRRLLERVSSFRIRIDAPLVVATLGGTGTGKSALVNALLGEEVARTGRSRPTTMRPTLICRPNLTPEMLGINPDSVELVHRDLPTLRDLVLIDCPDPDTTEQENPDPSLPPDPTALSRPQADGNLGRLRAVLPHCDVLLVTATQQKYRSARVSEELDAASRGAFLLYVQTHADLEDDIRDDWRRVLHAENRRVSRIFRVDSVQALADLQAGVQPRADFAELLDCLTHRMTGVAGHRIRRANFLDLVAATLEACQNRLEKAIPAVDAAQSAVEHQRAILANRLGAEMRTELLASRRQWENRLLSQAALHWGFSPFSLVLRAYQGLGSLLAGAMLYRARTPAQVALWGAFQGVRTWRHHQADQRAEEQLQRSIAGWDTPELHKAAIILDGYLADAGMNRLPAQTNNVAAEAESAAAQFVIRASGDLQSLIARLAKRHTGWWTRWRYEFLLLAMLAALLYRLGKNFFFDSWLQEPPSPVFGLDFYFSAAFWLLLWCLALLWAFCSRLRRGLRAEIDQLATLWQDGSAAAGLFSRAETECRRIHRFRQELDSLRQDVNQLQRRIADSENGER